MRRVLTIVSILLGISLLACAFPDDDDEQSPPPPEVEPEPCSNDHAAAYLEGEDGSHIAYRTPVEDILTANDECNAMRWHAGGGGQAGNTFHFTPWLIVPEGASEYDLEWVVYDPSGTEVARQGFQIFDIHWHHEGVGDGWQGVPTEIFIGPDLRGKNLDIVVDAENIETGEVISAQARVHLTARAPE